MSRSLLFSIVVFVAAVSVGQIAPALGRTSHEPPDAPGRAAVANEHRQGPFPTPPRRGAILINGKLVPAEQVAIDEVHDDGCLARHLHPQEGNSVTAFDGTVIPDHNPFECGYGKLEWFKPVQVFVLEIGDADFDGIPDQLDSAPNHADGNGNGIPDGAEDTDGDGLSDAYEILVSRTNRFVADSDGNGNDDSVDFTLSKWKPRYVTIPVIINIYANDLSILDAIIAVNRSNIVLNQARVRLQVVDQQYANDGDDGSGGGTANDGILTEEEFRKATEFGRFELANSTHKRGLKIIFAQLDLSGQHVVGASMRRFPVIAVSPHNRSDHQIGASIAHEFCHTAGIEGDPVSGSPEDTEGNVMRSADDGRDDFVNSSDPDKGIENLTLTPGQLEIVSGHGFPSLYGRPGTRKSPAVKREYQRGSAVDALGDSSGPGYLDIHTIDIGSHTDDEDIHMLLTLGDLFPDTGDVDAVYRLHFDIDDDPLTGEIGVIPGLDRTITIFVERNAGTTGLVVGAEISVADPPGSALLAPVPQLLTVERIADRTTIPNLPTAALFELHVPKDLLGMTAASVPGIVESYESATSLFADIVLVDFNRELWLQDPTLSVPVEYADRDELVPFSLTGLTPGDSYDLYLDDTLVHSGTLDAFGDDAGDFTIPATQPYDFCFLTAVDDTGLFAASALVVADAVFRDGFETGNSSLWSATVP